MSLFVIKSRLTSKKIRLKLLWTMFALIFHACVGRSGSIESLLVRDSQTSESLCCDLEQDTETGIKQKDKKSSRSDWDENIKANRYFIGCLLLDPSR